MQLQHNSKLKKHLTRALSLMLAFALALSTPLTTHADVGDSGDNTGGGGGGMSGSTSALAWSQYHQGYRMYIINSDFIRISPTYDFYYSTPTDIGDQCYSTRFDDASSPNEKYRYPITKLQEWCDSQYPVPTPTKLSNGNRIGNGYEFKQWFFAGKEGNSIDTGNGNGSGGNNNGGNPGTGTGDNQSYPNTVLAPDFNNDNYNDFTSAWTAVDCGELGLYPQGVISLTTYELILDFSEAIEQWQDYYYNVYSDNIGKWVDFDGDGIGDDQISQKNIKDYSIYLAFNKVCSVTTNDTLVDYAFMHYMYGAAELLRFCTVDYNDYEASYNPQSLLFQSIPLAGEEGGEQSGPSPASNLVRKNNTIDVTPRYETAADALQDGCYLVVEPITWLYVRTNPTGNWQNPSTYESTRTYGTYWNLASKWVGTGGFYNTIMTKLFNNCLAISRTVTSPTGKTLQGIESTNQKSVADSLNYMNAGYGLSMHIYDSSDFASSTSTYDEPLGSTPGKAPDDSDQLPEADRTNTAKYANIVKFYESENSVTINNQTATQITRDSFTRTPSPKTIF
ncbi:MAG: hypothetical protein IJX86_12935 [Lachnospiraceae bacterium]|nr:hypothetical protein [Lachnospiraceae bacterium]